MKFWEALKLAQETGIGIYRPSWNGNANRDDGIAQWVAIVPHGMTPIGEGPNIQNPFFYISQEGRDGHPGGYSTWVPSTGDLFADDWASL